MNDVEIANRRQDEGVMQSDPVSQETHSQRNGSSTDDRHDQKPRPVAGKRSEFGNSQGEDAGKHHRIEKSDKNDAPHRKMSDAEQGYADQAAGNERRDTENRPGSHSLQDGGAHEPPDHGTEPVKGNVLGGRQLGNISDARLTEIVDEETPDRNFRPYVDKDAHDAKHQMAKPQKVLERPPVRSVMLGSRHGRKLECGDRSSQCDERYPDDQVGQLDGGGFVHTIRLERIGRHLPYRVHTRRGRAKNQVTPEVRRNRRAHRIEGLGEIQAAGGGLRRTEDGYIRIGSDLQGCNPCCQDHECAQEQRIGRHHGGRNKQKRTDSHHKDADDHGPLVACPIDQLGCGQREYEISQKERELDQARLGILQIDFRRGIRTSFSTVTNPHMKNSEVTTASAAFREEVGAATEAAGEPALTIAMVIAEEPCVRLAFKRRAFSVHESYYSGGRNPGKDCDGR